MPAAQSVHVPEPEEENFPVGHELQDEEPEDDANPAGQLVQGDAAPLSAKVPAGQEVQVATDPPLEVPAAQSAHDVYL